MADELNATGKLFGEVIALRLMVQRLLAQMASQSGAFEEVLRIEHEATLADLQMMRIADNEPGRGEAIRMHAERVIDEMHTVMRQGIRPGR